MHFATTRSAYLASAMRASAFWGPSRETCFIASGAWHECCLCNSVSFWRESPSCMQVQDYAQGGHKWQCLYIPSLCPTKLALMQHTEAFCFSQLFVCNCFLRAIHYHETFTLVASRWTGRPRYREDLQWVSSLSRTCVCMHQTSDVAAFLELRPWSGMPYLEIHQRFCMLYYDEGCCFMGCSWTMSAYSLSFCLDPWNMASFLSGPSS